MQYLEDFSHTSFVTISDSHPMEESFNSQVSRSPSPVEQPNNYHLPSSPVIVNVVSDVCIPDSPQSSLGHLSSATNTSTSPDSATATPTKTASMSSSLSQLEPTKTSSPAKVPSECSNHLPPETSHNKSGSQRPPCPGVKLVLDNIDSTVRPRYQRLDSQNKSLHYVQVYAVKDRTDFSRLSDSPPSPGRSVYDILPTTSDYQMLKENFAILVARVLVDHIPYFKEDFKGLVPRHIQHPFSTEMAKQSEVVSCNLSSCTVFDLQKYGTTCVLVHTYMYTVFVCVCACVCVCVCVFTTIYVGMCVNTIM